MHSRQRIGAQTAVMAAAALLAFTAPAALVYAQSRDSTTRPDQPPAAAPRQPVAPSDAGPSVSDGTVPPGDTSLRTAADPATAVAQPAASGEPPGDATEPSAALGTATADGVIRDGTLAEETSSEPLDGQLAAEGRITDGLLGTSDALQDEIVAADPLRRPPQTVLRGPYQPVGVRMGSFVVFPEAELSGVASSNVFRSATRSEADYWAETRLGLRAQSNWSRHALEGDVQGLFSDHARFETENDTRFEGRVRGRVDIRRSTDVTGELGYTYGQESRGSIELPSTAGNRPNVTTRRAGTALNHRFNRVSVQVRGAVADTEYSTERGIDPNTGLPVVTGGPDRNYTQREVGTRVGYALKPGLSIFADAAFNDREHEAAAADGILRDSDGLRLRGGLAINVAGKWQGEISFGRASQRPLDRRLEEISGWIIDADLAWRPTGLTEVRFTSQTDIAATNVAGSGGALTRKAGVEVRHALRRSLIVIAGASYSVANYSGIDVAEHEFKSRLGAELYLSRETAITAGYEHTVYDTNGSARDYVDDTYRVGLRIRR